MPKRYSFRYLNVKDYFGFSINLLLALNLLVFVYFTPLGSLKNRGGGVWKYRCSELKKGCFWGELFGAILYENLDLDLIDCDIGSGLKIY